LWLRRNLGQKKTPAALTGVSFCGRQAWKCLGQLQDDEGANPPPKGGSRRLAAESMIFRPSAQPLSALPQVRSYRIFLPGDHVDGVVRTGGPTNAAAKAARRVNVNSF
jgi:hypothetical protein